MDRQVVSMYHFNKNQEENTVKGELAVIGQERPVYIQNRPERNPFIKPTSIILIICLSKNWIGEKYSLLKI